jgi:hypothetical protein
MFSFTIIDFVNQLKCIPLNIALIMLSSNLCNWEEFNMKIKDGFKYADFEDDDTNDVDDSDDSDDDTDDEEF